MQKLMKQRWKRHLKVKQLIFKFATEFADAGALTDDSYGELEKMGYPREMVDTYIKNAIEQSADAEAVMSVAGGSDGYKELTDWARGNMDEADKDLQPDG